MGEAVKGRLAAGLVSLVGAGLAGCGLPVASGSSWFVLRPDALPAPFVFESGAEGQFWLPEIMAAGVALFDMDGDEDLDLLLVNGGRLDGGAPPVGDDGAASRLYRNDGGWRFTDVTEGSGLGETGYGTGVATGDVDGDGDVDLYLANYGRDRLFLNDGTGRFDDATGTAGVDVGGWSASAAFCDYDGDRDLDLYVTRYVKYRPEQRCSDPLGRPDYCSPQNFEYETDVLLQNDGRGRFTDVSGPSGVASVALPGLGVACADLDDDGHLDWYVANDGTANLLWRNLGDGTFEDVALTMGVAFSGQGMPQAGMGVAAADLDGDGLVDLMVTNLTNEYNTLYRNLGAGRGFQDVTAGAGLVVPSLPYTGFGIMPVDFELDGDLDLVVANGGVRLLEEPGKLRSQIETADDVWDLYSQPNGAYLNDGAGQFVELDRAACGLCEPRAISRGIARGDLDGDGDLDLVLGAIGSAARLVENRAPRKGHWLRLAVRDVGRMGDAVGARVTVRAGDRRWVETVASAVGYVSASDPRLDIGLGPVERVDGAEVRWPDGTLETFAVACVDCTVDLRRGEGGAAP